MCDYFYLFFFWIDRRSYHAHCPVLYRACDPSSLAPWEC